MNKLYIVRHGQTDWNAEGLMQGTVDIELNETGIKQAETLKNKIEIKEVDICYCSPMKRTRKTAEIITGNELDVIYDENIIERGFGDYEGEKIDMNAIFLQWDYKANNSENNIESIRDCLNRADNFLEKLNKKYHNKTILIVSHGSFIKALHYCLIGYDEYTDFLSFSPKNGVLYEYSK